MQFLSPKKRRVIINVTSLIDVLFLMLIFFIVTSTFMEEQAMKLELPASETSTPKPETLTLNIAPGGQIRLNDAPVDLDHLQQALQRTMSTRPVTSLTIRADRAVTHGTVVQVMDTAKRSGVTKLVIATENPN